MVHNDMLKVDEKFDDLADIVPGMEKNAICLSIAAKIIIVHAVVSGGIEDPKGLFGSRKYEEIKPPEVEDFCYITDNTFSKEEVLGMEADILKALKRFITKVGQEGIDASELEFLSCYPAELSLLDYYCVKFLSSMVAASVIFLAHFMLSPKIHPWPSITYKPPELKECVLTIHDLYFGRKGGSLQAVRDKYKLHKFKCVATTPSPPEIPFLFF
ncbi:hypothetical protein TSUD_22540 [Trifolium subterraneum]|uniref:Uncharacterized protein n=1 Tax=Trifolium subterraneum TaxID=3900 RepID=A0A2Z6P152_TRISU|nr:hypothetical protein TSUD_22540 [Trifolium subterraneum]